jgi:hypothetical protein
MAPHGRSTIPAKHEKERRNLSTQVIKDQRSTIPFASHTMGIVNALDMGEFVPEIML